MSYVNWDVFTGLPGAVEANFENLCRTLMRRHYMQYGQFAALANQPGVEFHLKLEQACDLGTPGRWYGWQCRWYSLTSGQALGKTRRDKIEAAIRLTEQILPNLTDWVLWTRYPLTKGDQEWYYAISTRMKLVLWTSSEVEEYLSGPAQILRGTYFGELVLTPQVLTELHDKAVAPIQRRWQPQVHQKISVESRLRAMLGEREVWQDFENFIGQLDTDTSALEKNLIALKEPLADEVATLNAAARSAITILKEVATLLRQGNFGLLQQSTQYAFPTIPEIWFTLPRRLRAIRHPAALFVPNVLDSLNVTRRLLQELYAFLSSRICAVQADAGCGKTELAAQLTAAISTREAGILLHGNTLQAGQSLDDLVGRIVIQGKAVATMEQLIAAVDAAGQRANQRIPIIIDGLNEAEDPRNWKSLLATLRVSLEPFFNVLFVCTVRTEFAQETIPDGIETLTIPGFEEDTDAAIQRYFTYYKIDSSDAILPFRLLQHPLTLRLFCEVVNPRRQFVAKIDMMPESLAELFERYLEQSISRIEDISPRTRRYYAQDIRAALQEIGLALWEAKDRSLDLNAIRERLRDRDRPWNESIVRALEHDGVLIRVPGTSSSPGRIGILYDILAGYVIADALLRQNGSVWLQTWFSNITTREAIRETHTLATDILSALVGLVPKRLPGQQLWTMLKEPLRTQALLETASIEGKYLDDQTVTALESTLTTVPNAPAIIFRRVRTSRAIANHPLNADFLYRVLLPLPVVERDRLWSEWLRQYDVDVIADVRRLGERWQQSEERSQEDQLLARWVLWLLTSTIRVLRDWATYALYWYGRGQPKDLFDLALNAFPINDVYIVERVVAASYGIVMAHPQFSANFERSLSAYLEGLQTTFISNDAKYPTDHWLIHLYINGIFQFALKYYPNSLPSNLPLSSEVGLPFAPGIPVEIINSEDERSSEIAPTLGMDFTNYTLGSLIRNRRNYDMTNVNFQTALGHVRGTIWQLGWRQDVIGKIDRSIAGQRANRDQPPVERYGKKYSWQGFYTYAGKNQVTNARSTYDKRLAELQIDPSFPKAPPVAPFDFPLWNKSRLGDKKWVGSGEIVVPNDLLYCSNLLGNTGEWVAVQGYLNIGNYAAGRNVFGILSALVVDVENAEALETILSTKQHLGNGWIPRVPYDHLTFAGEIPWHPQFARKEETEDLYRASIETTTRAIAVETLAHEYRWESYHSEINNVGVVSVPSRCFAETLGLRSLPQSFNQILVDGSTASISLKAPNGYEGNLLYLREDLVRQYIGNRKLIWFIWGERQFNNDNFTSPEWYTQLLQRYSHIWRVIRRIEDIALV